MFVSCSSLKIIIYPLYIILENKYLKNSSLNLWYKFETIFKRAGVMMSLVMMVLIVTLGLQLSGKNYFGQRTP